MGSVPESYICSEWRNTTPVDAKEARVGVGFDTADGQQIRLSLSLESARSLAETLLLYLFLSQSQTSAGMPSVDVSTPLGSEKV